MNEVRKLEDMIKSGEYNLNEMINQLCEISGVIAEQQSQIEKLEKDLKNKNYEINRIQHERNTLKSMIQGIVDNI